MKRAASFRRGEGRPPLVFGHRGAAASLPENTLAAFDRAADEGADAIELDVRTCASGEVVVMHDPTLDRMTKGADARAVAALRYDELAQVDLGEGQRAPKLDEVLALAKRRGLLVNVEIKHDVPRRYEVVSATAKVLAARDPSVSVLVSSFDPRTIAWLRVLSPRLDVALLVSREARHQPLGRLARPLGAAAIHIERTRTEPPKVAALLARGLIVNVWTVNDPNEARDLAALGVDGLITDKPGEIRAALART